MGVALVISRQLLGHHAGSLRVVVRLRGVLQYVNNDVTGFSEYNLIYVVKRLYISPYKIVDITLI
jgi:hypothetical protein